MTTYVDSSALLKLYVEEADSPRARELLDDPGRWTTARHTRVEVRRNLSRVLTGDALVTFRGWFEHDWSELAVVELSPEVCEIAVELAETTGARTLVALHLGAASAAGADDGLPIVTFDRGLAGAARALGWTVLGT